MSPQGPISTTDLLVAYSNKMGGKEEPIIAAEVTNMGCF